MPYNTPFALVAANGTFGLTPTSFPDAKWMASVKIQVASAPAALAGLPAFLAAVGPAYIAFHSASGVSAGAKVWLTHLTGAIIGEDGKYYGDGTQSTSQYDLTDTVGSGAGALPWATACCYTLKTNKLRGVASKGRFYYPALGTAPSDNEGLWTSVVAGNRATAAKTLLDTLNAQALVHLSSGSFLAVCSNVGAGAYTKVTQVAVGRIPDRQERRESSLQEGYSVSTLA